MRAAEGTRTLDLLHGKAQPSQLGDYYLKDGERVEAPGRWAAGAQLFGLAANDAVSGEQLKALMAVRRPDDGRELRRAGGSGEASAAIDATFSAPKSVSAVWALADPGSRERIEVALETAVDRALAYATGQVSMVRRRVGRGTVVHEKPAGLVATSWRHTTARAVAQQRPDPQLHSHVLLHAAVRRDGLVLASELGRQLYRRRQAIVEPVFADTKFNRLLERFQRRGRSAVNCEWRLVHASHNTTSSSSTATISLPAGPNKPRPPHPARSSDGATTKPASASAASTALSDSHRAMRVSFGCDHDARASRRAGLR